MSRLRGLPSDWRRNGCQGTVELPRFSGHLIARQTGMSGVPGCDRLDTANRPATVRHDGDASMSDGGFPPPTGPPSEPDRAVRWWQHKWWIMPVWGWGIAGLVLLGVVGAVADDDEDNDDATPATSTSAAATSVETTTVTETTIAATTTAAEPTTTPAPTTTSSTTTTTTTTTTSTTTTTTVPPTTRPAPPTWTVTDVVDGDTVDVTSDTGRTERIRVIGIDAPVISISHRGRPR